MKRLYPLATQALLDQIVSHRMRGGAVLPATKVLARELGFTPVVIQKASQALISRGVLDRVGYKLIVRTEQSVRFLERPIYVIAFQDFLGNQARRWLTQHGVSHRIIEASYGKHPRLGPLWAEVLAQKPGGIILGSPPRDSETKSLIAAAGVPVVVCGAEYGLTEASATLDAYRGTEAALNHLYELGHRRIAHVTSFQQEHEELTEYYRIACHKLNLRRAASSIWRTKISSVEALRETMRLKHRQYPEVTALFCHVKVGLWAAEVFKVPDELSVVGLGDWGKEERGPALTTIQLSDPECLAKWACTEIISQVQAIASGRPRPRSSPAFFAPRLVQRASTRALANREIVAKPAEALAPSKPAPSETWKKIYPYLKRRTATEWLRLDISKLTNHSLTRRYGWLGAEPLEHFPPGLRSAHGVPFQILDERRNGGRAVITFRSPHSHSSEGKLLPTKVKIRLNSRLKALYFLHGCGWAIPSTFAEYRIYYGPEDFESAGLFPLGLSSRKVLKQMYGHRPNVQDWWPGNEQIHFPHAHYATVFDPADPAGYERTLYSLEWINPRPRDEIKFIQVSVDPNAGPSLALIAVSALL